MQTHASFVPGNHKVLIVDDEPEILHEICRRYNDEGYQVLRAGSGNSAFPIIENEHPDLLLTDLRMLDGHGSDLIERVMGQPQPRPLVFCMTAYNDITQNQSFENGVDYFLQKPFDLTTLMSATRHFLAEREELLSAYFDLRGLVDLLPGTVFVLRANGEIIHGNAAGLAIARHFQSITNRAYLQFLAHPNYSAEIQELLHCAQKHPTLAWTGDLVLDGDKLTAAEIYLVDSVWRHENVKIALAIDISEHKKALLQQQDQQRLLEERHTTSERYASSVYHELRNALTVLEANGSMLKELPLPPMSERYVSRINSSTRNLISLLHDLSDMSALESGKLQLLPEQFVIENMLHGVISDACCSFAAQSERVHMVCDTSLRDPVQGPRSRLQQVLYNVLSNAFKYGTETTQIRITAKSLERTDRTLLVEFSIQDDGPGISAEDLPHLFEPFFRGKQSNGPRKGSGLGLFLSKRLVEMMGGVLSAESHEGTGTTMRIRMPFNLQ
jgi:signal transduction histidine kinase/CheY-like chemotaxis protein